MTLGTGIFGAVGLLGVALMLIASIPIYQNVNKGGGFCLFVAAFLVMGGVLNTINSLTP